MTRKASVPPLTGDQPLELQHIDWAFSDDQRCVRLSVHGTDLRSIQLEMRREELRPLIAYLLQIHSTVYPEESGGAAGS